MIRVEDQAASLRRMAQVLHSPQSFAFVGGRAAGTTTLVAELGTALAQQQNARVALFDAHPVRALVRRMARHELETLDKVIQHQLPLDAAVAPLSDNLVLVGFHSRPRLLAELHLALAHRLEGEFTALVRDLNYLLFDVPAAELALAGIADDVIVVLSPDHDCLTEVYAQIKRLAGEYGQRRFNVLLNRVHTLAEARLWFARLSAVAGQYLSVSLRWVGYVPEDHWAKRAAILRTTTVQSFPDSETAAAISQLAARLPQWSTRSGSVPDLFNRLCEATRLNGPLPSDLT